MAGYRFNHFHGQVPMQVSPLKRHILLWLCILLVHLPIVAQGKTKSPDFGKPWQPQGAEKPLLDLDLDGPGTTFDLLGDQEGASIIFRVRDAVSKKKLAVIKLNSRHSQASAEVFAWRMACYLGFPEIVVPATPVTLQGGSLLKLRRLFLNLTYSDPAKEKKRLEIVENLNKASAGSLVFSGVVKPWLTSFMFTEELGKLEVLAQSPVSTWLKRDAFPPGSGNYTLQQRTRLYKPQGIHLGTISKKQLAFDMSNIMVLDALMGQSDRFAGANLHFWCKGGKRVELPPENKRKVWDLGHVRLLALDNGLAFRGRNGNGLFDLQGLNEPGTRVERFDPKTVERIRALGKIFLAPSPNAKENAPRPRENWAYFGLETKHFSLAQYYLRGTLTYINSLAKVHSHDIYLRH